MASQWSCWSSDANEIDLSDWKTTRACVFWTRCRVLIEYFGDPYRTELAQSRRERVKCSVSVQSMSNVTERFYVKERRFWDRFTCLRKLKLLSIMTSRSIMWSGQPWMNNGTTHINTRNVEQRMVATICAKKNGVRIARIKSKTIMEEPSRYWWESRFKDLEIRSRVS